MSIPAWRKFTDEQKRAAFLVDRPVLAAAGAGAGKTAVMAVRYVSCLLSVCDEKYLLPDRILAVSFTREAAGNLRARIERTLRLVLRVGSFPQFVEGEGFQEEALSSAQMEHLRKCLERLPHAPIATVDALCLQWVAEHAALLGRDPDVHPPEELTWEQVREQAWQQLCAEELGHPHSDLVRVVDAYGVHAVQRLVQRLGDQAAALPMQKIAALTGDAVALVCERRAPVLEALADAVADAQALPAKGKVLDKLRAESAAPPSEQTRFCSWLNTLSDVSLVGVRDDAIKEMIGTIQDLVDLPNQREDGKRPGPATRRQFASLAGLGYFNDACEQELQQRAVSFARLAASWLRHLGTCAEEAHLSGFAAIEAQALTLLEMPAMRKRLGTRYRHILLDEAQDLNRLQGRLIEALQAGGGEQAARIFVVGDHRQSIYGFRHAEPAIFKGWESDIDQRGGIAAELAENFRSHPDLLTQVRALFEQESLNEDFNPAAIKAGRKSEDFVGRPGLLHGWRIAATTDGVALDIKPQLVAASEIQARHVAELIRTSINEGRTAEDHAILLRTRSRMRIYAQALERAGIAYDTDFPGGLYEAQECHDIEAIIRLCINQHDRRALAIALGGPWGAEDPNDRCIMVECLSTEPDKGWQLATSKTALGTIVAQIRVVLAEEGVAAAIRRLLTSEHLTSRYAALPLARRRLANLIHLAEEEDKAGVALDASAFIARLHERRRLGVDGEEAAGEHLGSRGVRLMTVHQSKGLEWPVVFLPDIHRPFDKRDLTAKALAMVENDQLLVACHPGDIDDDDVVGQKAGLTADHLRKRQQAEEARLFYVASTRAQDTLHIIMPAQAKVYGPNRDGSARSAADWLIGAQITWIDITIETNKPVEQLSLDKIVHQELPVLQLATSDEQVVLSVTDIAAHSGHSKIKFKNSLSRDEAMAFGIAVHKLLEYNQGPGIDRDVIEQHLRSYAGIIPKERWENLIKQLSNKDLIPGFDDFPNRLIEQPVVCERFDSEKGKTTLVHGVCDVILQDKKGEWHLYDWKTGDAAQDDSSFAQLQLYADLITPHLDGPLVSITIVDIERGVLIPVPFTVSKEK